MSERHHALERQFERILNEYGGAISRLAYGYEPAASVREELVQEIGMALAQFRGECSERTFVFRIAHNRGLTHVWRRRPAHQSLEDLQEPDQPIDPRPHPDEQVACSDQRARLMAGGSVVARRAPAEAPADDRAHAGRSVARGNRRGGRHHRKQCGGSAEPGEKGVESPSVQGRRKANAPQILLPLGSTPMALSCTEKCFATNIDRIPDPEKARPHCALDRASSQESRQ